MIISRQTQDSNNESLLLLPELLKIGLINTYHIINQEFIMFAYTYMSNNIGLWNNCSQDRLAKCAICGQMITIYHIYHADIICRTCSEYILSRFEYFTITIYEFNESRILHIHNATRGLTIMTQVDNLISVDDLISLIRDQRNKTWVDVYMRHKKLLWDYIRYKQYVGYCVKYWIDIYMLICAIYADAHYTLPEICGYILYKILLLVNT